MKLIAQKPCSFGGKRFYIGDEIPGEFVLNPIDQEKRGILAIVNDANDSVEPGGDATVVRLVIPGKEGEVALDLAPESIQTVMNVLTANAEEAAEMVKQITSDDILFLVNAADSRKTVQAAAKARAQALAEGAAGQGNQNGSDGDQ
jgi:hypothetical protein